MRVIAGEFRSRRLLSLPGLDTRPTSDRLRETLFNILAATIEDAIFVDAYAGTGAVGIEALSRGARHCIFIEKDFNATEVIRENLANLNLAARSQVIKGAAALHLGKADGDIVFLDPPYPKEREYRAALDVLELKPPLLTVIQHSARFSMAERYGALRRTRLLKQSDNALSFFRREDRSEDDQPSSTVSGA